MGIELTQNSSYCETLRFSKKGEKCAIKEPFSHDFLLKERRKKL